jgi:hypothetical protein
MTGSLAGDALQSGEDMIVEPQHLATARGGSGSYRASMTGRSSANDTRQLEPSASTVAVRELIRTMRPMCVCRYRSSNDT